MKKILLLFFTCFILLSAKFVFSQSVPQGMNYQAVARDANGVELISKALTVKLAVKSKSGSTYTTQWEETHSVTTNAYGLFTLVIGQGTTTGTGTQTSFSNVPWSSYDMYLNVSVDDGNGYVDLGKTQLVSVPYAFVAGSVASSSSSNTGWLLTGNSGTSTSTDFIGTSDNTNLLFKTNNSELKIKGKAPKSGKPGKKGDDEAPKADFCSLKTSDREIMKDLFFDLHDFSEEIGRAHV